MNDISNSHILRTLRQDKTMQQFSDVEILFAQKLASADHKTRRTALAKLRRYVTSRLSFENLFTNGDLIKLWKGLYYCMWMQDKPVIQEEIAENISKLITSFKAVDSQALLFMSTFFETMVREWYTIDRWRLDKFMMFVRRFLRAYFNWLKSIEWSEECVEATIEFWKKNVFSTDAEVPGGLKYHFASIYLDELDFVGSNMLNEKQVLTMLMPYICLLKEPISDLFFTTIIREIFETMLLQFSADSDQKSKPEQQETPDNARLNVSWAAFSDYLFETGKSKRLGSDRRRIIYTLVKRFRVAAKGEDPMTEEFVVDYSSGISDSEIEGAAEELLKLQERPKLVRGKRKRRALSSDDNCAISSDLSKIVLPTDLKRKKKRSVVKSDKGEMTSDVKVKQKKKKERKDKSSSEVQTDVNAVPVPEVVHLPDCSIASTSVHEEHKAVSTSALKTSKHKNDRYFSNQLKDRSEAVTAEETSASVSGKRKRSFVRIGKTEQQQVRRKTTAYIVPDLMISEKQVNQLNAFMDNPPSFMKKVTEKVKRSKFITT